ncbi:hypothetical protein [Ornithinibacillus halotolerans]|uniref:F0F1 ATP synthase subunit C n=1 Tax=Ornithinibacillus halotolerans TaxID=1274357 RepID=A0A916W3K8_9BACI|nr:hypothetical protein [Ornithinibacillus halotolerans]GGA64569.1 hypothetical protein GCM10008025_05540 [Ornithinibacillus halotolerans]
MSSAYYFALAAILAVLAILLVFKLNVEKLKENPQQIGQVQTRFFIGVAVAESIPIVLIILGFLGLETVSSIEELYIPGAIVIFSMIFAPFFIMLQKSVGVPEEAKQTINTFSFIGIAMANAIPIISLACLFLMMP